MTLDRSESITATHARALGMFRLRRSADGGHSDNRKKITHTHDLGPAPSCVGTDQLVVVVVRHAGWPDVRVEHRGVAGFAVDAA